MADYFVSADRGSDSTGAGSAVNPWKTIGKAIDGGVSPGPAITLPGAGPTRVVIEPGVYREAVQCRLSPTSAAPLEIVGDVDGALFGAAGFPSPQKGAVEWRAWSDDSTPINAACFSASGKGYYSLRRLKFVGGSGTSNALVLTNPDGAAVEDCEIVFGLAGGSAQLVNLGLAEAGAGGFRFRRCDFHTHLGGTSRAIYLTATRADADYNADLLIESCRFTGGSRAVEISSTGGKPRTATGIKIACCTLWGVAQGITVADATYAAESVEVAGCLFLACGTGLSANTSGQLVEDYNVLNAGTPRSNVTAGARSVVGVAPTVNLEDQRIDGSAHRPRLEPLAGSSFLGFAPRPYGVTLDLYGRERPNPCAVGCLERVDPTAPSGNTYLFMVES